jgi:transcriptional regulator with XRE-family HTH domain
VPITINQRFGRRIVVLRKERGWSQEKLGEHTGISMDHISHLENGHREPCLGTMVKLAHAFRLSMAELFQDFDSPKR